MEWFKNLFTTKQEAQKEIISEMFQEAELVREMKLKFNLILILFAVLLTSEILVKKSHWFIVSDEFLSKEASKRDFCSMAMNQIIAHKLSNKIITDNLYEIITSDNYRNMPFDDGDSVSEVFTNESKCKVLVKTKAGLRSFDFTLRTSFDESFFYKVEKIFENELVEREA